LVLYGEIKTTKAKAKFVQSEIDKIMTLVRKNTLNARRAVLAKLGNDKETTRKLFTELLSLTKKRKSGFTRIINLPRRRGDLAQIVRFEWVEKPGSAKGKVRSVKKKTKKIKTKKT